MAAKKKRTVDISTVISNNKKPNYDINAIIGKKIKDQQWKEFSAWINGADAKGGKDAQVALAKSRAAQIMKDFGPKPKQSIRQAEGRGASNSAPAPRKAAPKATPAKRSGSSTGIRKAGPQAPKSGPYSRFK